MKYSAGSASVSNMQYVDTHAHLFDEAFHDDFHDVVRRAENAGITKTLIITLKHEETMQAIAFAGKDPEHYQVAAAIFPEDADKITDADYAQFEKDAALPQVSVLGEMGLEYHWVKDPGIRQLQRDLFVKQMELAKALNKPVAVHARDAMQDTYDLMKQVHPRGLLHCFSGTREMAKEFTKLGFFLALGGALTFKNARHSVEVVETVDEKWLLTETDCPYMAPEPVRGTRNEPANIPYILAKMASVRNESVEHMADVVMANYERYLHG